MAPILDKLPGIFRQRNRAADQTNPAVPDGRRIYVIGDIHGRVDLVSKLHDLIRMDAAPVSDEISKTLIYLGDYVDRGLDSKAVIDLLLGSSMGSFETVHLKGNHEDALLRFLADESYGNDWFAIGGDATAISYGVRVPGALSSAKRREHIWRELRAQIPQGHLDFLTELALSHSVGDYFFAHAGVRPGIPLSQQLPQDLMWIRKDFLESSQNHGKVVVHGHSLFRKPESLPHRIGIDTGAFATNVLTCLVLEGTSRRFLATGSAIEDR